jgi:hypothetical protein
MKNDFLTGRNYIGFSGELHEPVRYVIQTEFLVGMLAPIINVSRLSAEIFVIGSEPLNERTGIRSQNVKSAIKKE